MENINSRIEAETETDASESAPAREAAAETNPVLPQQVGADASEPASAGEVIAKEGESGEPENGEVDPVASLSPEQRARIEKAEKRLRAIARKSTDEAFETGIELAEIRSCYGEDEGGWKAWVKLRGEMNMRTAGNYISLPTKLGAYRKRAVANRVPSAALYAIANADPEVIEEVMARYESGSRPTVSEVKAIANGSAPARQEEAADPADVGGLAGLRALGVDKVKVGTKVFGDRIGGILNAIEPALEPHWRGKRVSKSALAKAVQFEARRARTELESVAVFVEPNDHGPSWNVHPVLFPAGSGWRKVSETLYRLGGIETWPAADKVGSWLADEVIPTLEWATGRKSKSHEPDEETEPTAEVKPAARAKTKPEAKAKPKRKAKSESGAASKSASRRTGPAVSESGKSKLPSGFGYVKFPDGTEGITF